MGKIEKTPPYTSKKMEIGNDLDAKKATPGFTILSVPSDLGGKIQTPIVNAAALASVCSKFEMKLVNKMFQKFKENREEIEKQSKEDTKTKTDRKEHIRATDKTGKGKKEDWWDKFIRYIMLINPEL